MEKGRIYIETYGCQMNVNDSEVMLSILHDAGYVRTMDMNDADIILVNTCAIRDNAEQRIHGRLEQFRLQKQRRGNVIVGVTGCMAERLKDKLLDNHIVDLVAGPDAYRDLPRMIEATTPDSPQINVLLSHEETYADIIPERMDRNGVSAYISIMRGCSFFDTSKPISRSFAFLSILKTAFSISSAMNFLSSSSEPAQARVIGWSFAYNVPLQIRPIHNPGMSGCMPVAGCFISSLSISERLAIIAPCISSG